MTEQLIILWCYIEGQPNCFRVSVSISPSCIVDELVKQIYDQHVKFIVECSYASLTLTKVGLTRDLYVNINVITNVLCWFMTPAGQRSS